MELIEYSERSRRWSEKTFGTGDRSAGIIAHIRKELDEIEADPNDLFEWVDVIILALDGARRVGWSSNEIVAALIEKQKTNELRQWPDWRTVSTGRPIEHIGA